MDAVSFANIAALLHWFIPAVACCGLAGIGWVRRKG